MFFLIILLLALNTVVRASNETVYLIKNWGRTLNTVHNFRKMSDPVYLCDTYGLATLSASGSGQFSQQGLEKMLAVIDKPLNEIYIVDLRQESHGFIIAPDDSYPISWYKEHNSINWGKNNSTIDQEELELCRSLQEPVDIYSASWLYNPLMTVPKIEYCLTERELITLFPGLHYIRITVADEQAPTDEQVDQFVSLITSLPTSAWLHFHCFGGRGRTTMFLCLFDMMHNARNVTLEEIINRQAFIGGVNLFDRLLRSSWYRSHHRQRKQLLIDFYTYAQNNLPSFDISFSSWKKQRARREVYRDTTADCSSP